MRTHSQQDGHIATGLKELCDLQRRDEVSRVWSTRRRRAPVDFRVALSLIQDLLDNRTVDNLREVLSDERHALSRAKSRHLHLQRPMCILDV